MSRQTATSNVSPQRHWIGCEFFRLLYRLIFQRLCCAKWCSLPRHCMIVATVLASGLADAGSLAVSPLRLTFSPSSALGVITVENNGRDEALVQAETFAWTQTNGEHRLTATDDVIAMPPVFRLAPGAQRQVRVGLTRAFAEKNEQTYRLTITEVSTATVPGVVAVTVRHSLPIFVRSALPLPSSLAAKGVTPTGLEIANTGGEHLRILRWRLRDSSGAAVAENTGPGYLLAGASQMITTDKVRAQAATPGPIHAVTKEPLVLEADTEHRTLKILVGQ